MKIIILDSLFRQHEDNYSVDIPKEVLPRLFKEFHRLDEMERSGQNSVEEYIKNHHGIKMKGTDKIFKYELTDGDRMLYTYSKDLPWLSCRVENSIVLLRYSKHDNQGDAARKFDLKKERGYKYIKEVVENMTDLDIDVVNNSDISIEDYVALADILNSDDYTAWHKVYVIADDLDYSTLTLDEMDVFLSNEQGRCITEFFEKPCPTLIIGGAGTGKTLIAVNMLINYAKDNSQKKAFYFTQSSELRNKVISLYKQYGEITETENVEFQDINEYCIELLGLKHASIVGTREFLSFVEDTPAILETCRKNDLSPIVVWTEIRGLIKGGMSAEWTRTGSIAQSQFTGSIKSLIERGYFIRSEDDKKRVLLANNSVAETKKKLALDEDISNAERKNLNLAFDYFSGFDHTIRCLPKSDYLNVSEELSSVEKDKRPAVWDICKQYDENLISNSLYDENDLVRMMFERGIRSEHKCSFSIIDEVQDYTELQLFLIKTLTEGEQIVFAGDEHQNINPASFSESRMRSLFYQRKNTKLRIKRLQKNFRCQQGIIDITNALAAIRRTAIGSGSAENEIPEEAIRQSEALPYRLAFSEKNLASCICELMPYPKAVFLVPDETTKAFLKAKINQLKDTITSRIGVEKFNARLKSAVFTVAEIKGVEYEYVICYDLIGSNLSTWQRILSGVHHQTKYRYYFNLLYVAMTRAQEYLCLIDTKLSEELDRQMGIQSIELFDAERLFFNRLGASEADWYEQARELEKNGKYREALEMYKAAKAEASCINRCNYYISIEDKDYDTAMLNAIALDAPELIDAYWEDIKDPELKRFAEAYTVLKKDPMNYEFRRVNLSMLTQSIVPDILQSDVQSVILQTLSNALHKHKIEFEAIAGNRAEKTNPGVLKTKPESVVKDDKRASGKDYTKPEEAFSEEELELFRRIKKLRDQIAEELEIDEYRVVTYVTMVDMTLKMPTTRDEFSKVNGIRNRELEQFGNRFIDEIRKFIREKGVTNERDTHSRLQSGLTGKSAAAETSKDLAADATQISQPIKDEHRTIHDKEESNKISCKNCKLYKNESCSGVDGPCNDYEHTPIITDEEKKAWPTSMQGPYGNWNYSKKR